MAEVKVIKGAKVMTDFTKILAQAKELECKDEGKPSKN